VTEYDSGAPGHALDAAADAGAETELIDLREWDLPLFDPDHRDRGDAEAPGASWGYRRRHHGHASLSRHDGVLGAEERLRLPGQGRVRGQDRRPLGHGRRRVVRPDARTPANRRSDGPRLDTPHEVGIRGASSAFDADGEFVDPTWRPASRKLGRMATEYALIEPQRV